MMLSRSFKHALRRSGFLCSFSSLGNPIVEEKYILPEVPKNTAAIIKIIYEREDNPPTSAELYDAVQEYLDYPSKMRMKFDLQHLKSKGYIAYRRPQKPGAPKPLLHGPSRSWQLHLTSKVHINELKPEDKWSKKRVPRELREYLLPGMPLETTLAVKVLMEAETRQMSLEALWREVQPFRYYRDMETLRRILAQLKTMRYAKLEITCDEGRGSHEGVFASGMMLDGSEEELVKLSSNIDMRDGELIVQPPKRHPTKRETRWEREGVRKENRRNEFHY